eukprot:517114_1
MSAHKPIGNGTIKAHATSNTSIQTTSHKFPYHERRYLDPLEQAIPFFYTMHSMMAIALIVFPLIYIAVVDPPNSESVTRILVYFGLYVYFVIGGMIFPSGPFIRPHPLIWRLIFACSLLYLFILIILIILPPMDARMFLATIDPSLGKPIILPLYAEDCSITYDNIMNKMDRFVIAHFLGWFVKGLLIRHRLILWWMSISWELIELSTFYYIPNFAECWWDQWVLDVLICNGLGLELGLLTCKYFEHKKYEWCELFDEQTLMNKSCHILKLFSPKTWVRVKWEAGHSIVRFIQLLFIIFCIQLNEMNAFLLKLYLWIPSEHWWNLARLILLSFCTIPAIRQYYFYVTDPNIHRMGSQVFILLLIICLETLLAYKMAPDNIPHAPLINKICWTLSALTFVLFAFFVVRKFDHQDEHDIKKKTMTNDCMFDSNFLCLIQVLLAWSRS